MKKIILIIVLTGFLENRITAQNWSSLGPGVGNSNAGTVLSSALYNGELYAGGNFTSAGGITANNIARWNGTTWSPVLNGISGSVRSLCTYNGELYAAGSFATAGNTAANDIARWNGTTWKNVGYLESYSIKTLAVYDDELYAAGFFSFPNFPDGVAIAKWNGNNWTPVGPEVSYYSPSIECMEVYNGELYIAGAYYLIGGGGVAEYFRVSKWDGYNWSDVVTIPASYTLDGALGGIFSMKTYNGELYVAGQFSGIDTIWASQIARWNGNNWSAVGSGINFESYQYGFDGAYYTYVSSLEVYNGALYAAGFFNHCDTILSRSIAKWDGAGWSNLGLGLVNNSGIGWGYGFTMVSTDTALFVGGRFNYVNGYNGIAANNIASWREACSSAPSQPVSIHGNDTACSNTSQTYYVNEIPGAASYTWTLPNGWNGHSSTNTITVVTGINNGSISVVANNSCGTSSAQSLEVFITGNTSPVLQGNINGSNSPCIGSTQTYSIPAVPNAIDYTWSFPSGWIGGSNDTSITLITGYSNGIVSVRANNNCGSSVANILPVVVATVPHKPDLIQGKNIVCAGTENLYYVQWPQPATNYSWLLPQGWMGQSLTDSITAIAGNSNGEISVSANNSCGSSDYTTLTVMVDSLPFQPENIIGNRYINTNEFNYYSVTPVTGAIAYHWSSAAATIQGQNMSAISAQWKKAGTYELAVQTINRCGSSERKKIIVEVADFNTKDPFDFKIFPNPSNGQFYLNAKRVQNKIIRIEVFTITGQLIYKSGNRPGSNDYTQFIDLKKLQQASYFLKIVIDYKIYARKIVIH